MSSYLYKVIRDHKSQPNKNKRKATSSRASQQMNLDPMHSTFIRQAGETWIRDYACDDCNFQLSIIAVDANIIREFIHLSYKQCTSTDALLV